jgi:hypothetical protein
VILCDNEAVFERMCGILWKGNAYVPSVGSRLVGLCLRAHAGGGLVTVSIPVPLKSERPRDTIGVSKG